MKEVAFPPDGELGLTGPGRSVAGRDVRVDTPVLSHSVPGQDMPAVAAGTGQPTGQRVAH